MVCSCDYKNETDNMVIEDMNINKNINIVAEKNSHDITQIKKFLLKATEEKHKLIKAIYNELSEDNSIIGKTEEGLTIMKSDIDYARISAMTPYYSKKMIVDEMRKYGIIVDNNNIGIIVGADGEMINEIKDKSRVDIISESNNEVLIEVQLFEESEEEYWISQIVLEVNNDNYKVQDIKELDYISDKEIVSSSNLEKYPVSNAFDFDIDTSWAEAKNQEGVGEWINIKFNNVESIHGIDILNGYSGSEELYYANNRVKKIKIEFYDGYVIEKELEDQIPFILQRIDFERRESDYIKITVLDIYKGNKYNDTCISEIRIF